MSFEQTQGTAYRYLYLTKDSSAEGQIEARRLYGTPEENRYSIINAIRRNPIAFLQRLKQVIKKAPKEALRAYGACYGKKMGRAASGLGLVLFLLAARGIIEIYKSKAYALLCVIFLWPANLFLYLFSFLSAHYFTLPYFLVLSLAAAGLESVLSDFKNRFLRLRSPPGSIGIILILFILLGMRGNFPVFKQRTLGVTPEEKAMLFMQKNLERGSRVGSYAAGSALSAGMTRVTMAIDYSYLSPTQYLSAIDLRRISSEEELIAWITKQDLKAVYVDKYLRNWNPGVYGLIKKETGKSLKVGFTSENGEVQVLLVDIH